MLETLKFQKLDRRAKLTQAHDGDAVDHLQHTLNSLVGNPESEK